MDIILISGSILSFSLAVFLVIKKKERLLADNILAFWLFVFSLDFIRSYMLFFKEKLFLLGFGYTLPLLFAPLLYIYVMSIIKNKKKFDMAFLWHFIPFIISNIYMYFYIYTKSPEWRFNFLENTSFSSRPLVFNTFLIIVSAVYPIYVFIIYKELKKYLTELKRKVSCKDHIDLFWVNYLLISVMVLWLVSLYSKFVSGYFYNLQYSDATMAVYFFELIIIMIIGYFGFKQGIIFMGSSVTEVDDIEIEKYKTTGLSSNDAKNFLPVLLEFMESKKPYLNSQLTISQLAGQLKIPQHHLSQIINEQIGKNFFEFVNSYRVEEVKRRIAENQNNKFTLLAIAYDSGFNSKSSFNTIFKKQTGLTPKEYMKKQKGNSE
jgi:AraC-like DNA-binding protein